MTTKKFIEMLRKADPTGEGHIRMSGGIPTFAVAKEGYWDGPYTYLDDDGNYVLSIQGYKVDISTTDLYDFVINNMEHYYYKFHDKNEEWGKIKSKFKFEIGGYANASQRNERADNLLKEAKEYFDEWYDHQLKNGEETIQKMIDNANKGWTWFQNKLVDTEGGMHHYYTWKVIKENGENDGSCIHNTMVIQKSGLWKRVDNNVKPGYYQWILKKDNQY